MSRISYSISLPYKQEELYNLVLDIESYPNFVPWCSASRIITRNEKEITAQLLIKYKIFTSKYTSKVDITSKDKILVKLIDGPFKFLDTFWKFEQEKSNTKIYFCLNFELKSKFLDELFMSNIDSYAKEIFDSFIKRAKNIYGE